MPNEDQLPKEIMTFIHGACDVCSYPVEMSHTIKKIAEVQDGVVTIITTFLPKGFKSKKNWKEETALLFDIKCPQCNYSRCIMVI